MQKAIADYRSNRISNYKLVFPRLTRHTKSKSIDAHGTVRSGGGENVDESGPEHLKRHAARKARVSASVAPVTMFQRNKGLTNADIIYQVWKRSVVS